MVLGAAFEVLSGEADQLEAVGVEDVAAALARGSDRVLLLVERGAIGLDVFARQ